MARSRFAASTRSQSRVAAVTFAVAAASAARAAGCAASPALQGSFAASCTNSEVDKSNFNVCKASVAALLTVIS